VVLRDGLIVEDTADFARAMQPSTHHLAGRNNRKNLKTPITSLPMKDS